MRIKRKKLERLNLELAHYKRMAKTEFKVTFNDEDVIECSLHDMYFAGKYSGGIDLLQARVRGTYVSMYVTPQEEPVTGYELFLANKYGGKDDTDTSSAPESAPARAGQ
jgi:hypothetical protein